MELLLFILWGAGGFGAFFLLQDSIISKGYYSGGTWQLFKEYVILVALSIVWFIAVPYIMWALFGKH